MTTSSYREQIDALRLARPGLRARELGRQLGLSEMQVVAARQGEGCTRLRGAPADWLSGLGALGPVMALTRNETVVHERRGQYGPLQGERNVRMVLGPDIDLRLFLDEWATGWAVEERGRRSLQFFDAAGEAVHKVWLEEGSHTHAWARLVEELRTDEPPPPPRARPPRPASRPDEAIDGPAFQEAWRGLRDTHDFFLLLRRFGLDRAQALRLGPPECVRALPPACLGTVLREAASAALPIMAFVGNPGCVQIHTGTVHVVARSGDWLNVLDRRFNLHIQEPRLAAAWWVRKPTRDGPVDALELFDVDGELVLQLFGERKPGRPQLHAWEALLAGL